MKKLITVGLLLIGFGVALAAVDVDMTITIKKEKVAEHIPGILRMKPKARIPDPSFFDDPNDPNDFAPMIDELTTKQHIKNIIIDYLYTLSSRGNEKLALDAVVHSRDGIE